MSIASAITAAQGKVANAYTAVSNKGGTLPATQNLSNLATAISSIPSGGTPTLITKSITQNGTYNASSDNADGYSSVTVNVSGGGGSISRLFTANYWVDTSGNVHNIEDYEGNTISAEATSIPSPKDIDYDNVDNIKYLDCSNLVSISGRICFSNCDNLEGLDFSNLETAGDNAFQLGIYGNPKLTQIVFPKLTSAGYRCFALNKSASFYNDGMSITARFPSLSNLNAGNIFYYAFGGYQSVIIYFNALTTSSFGSNINQFQQIVYSTEEAEIHFPSNMQSTISGLTGYPTFGGENTTLVFDLPATS